MRGNDAGSGPAVSVDAWKRRLDMFDSCWRAGMEQSPTGKLEVYAEIDGLQLPSCGFW